jgi:hypothetical protein
MAAAAVVVVVPKLGPAVVKIQVVQRAGYAVLGPHTEEVPCWLEV